MIRSNLSPSPKFPATSSDLVPFLCAVVLPSLLPPPLVLLAEDGSTDIKMLGEWKSQLPTRVQRKECEWTMHSHSSYYGYEDRHRSATVTAQTSHHEWPVFSNGYLVHVCRAWSLFLIRSMCSLTVHLADTRPHSPTTLAYEDSPSIIGSSHTIYGETGHEQTCAYRLLSFPICQPGSHNIALSHFFFHISR